MLVKRFNMQRGVMVRYITINFHICLSTQTEEETAKQFCQKVLDSESEYQVSQCLSTAAAVSDEFTLMSVSQSVSKCQ